MAVLLKKKQVLRRVLKLPLPERVGRLKYATNRNEVSVNRDGMGVLSRLSFKVYLGQGSLRSRHPHFCTPPLWLAGTRGLKKMRDTNLVATRQCTPAFKSKKMSCISGLSSDLKTKYNSSLIVHLGVLIKSENE